MSYIVPVEIWKIKEKLPDIFSMIIAWDGDKWDILMYDGENVGYAWEDDTPIRFYKWAYLGDLNK